MQENDKNREKIIKANIKPTKKNTKKQFIDHIMSVMKAPIIDLNDPLEVEKQIDMYFKICQRDGLKPEVEGLAAMLKISREGIMLISGETLEEENLTEETKELIKDAYYKIKAMKKE